MCGFAGLIKDAFGRTVGGICASVMATAYIIAFNIAGTLLLLRGLRKKRSAEVVTGCAMLLPGFFALTYVILFYVFYYLI